MKKLKYILTALTLICAAAGHQLRAETLPLYFGDLRSEVTNQLTIASNTVVVDKKLISKLKATLKTIDKNKTNTLAASTKTLALVAKSLNQTTLSNIFDSNIQLVVDLYVSNYFSAQSDLASRLVSTFPGKSHDAADKAMAKLLAAIDAADTNLNSTIASKALSSSSKALVVATKSVTKAEAAPQPPATYQATIAINGASTTTFRPTLAVAVQGGPGDFFINAVGHSGSGLSTKALSLSFAITDLVDGANPTATITAGGANQYTVAGLGSGNTTFISTGGTTQVNWNSAAKLLSGSFSFNSSEQDGSRTAVISGTFVITYQ